MQCQLGKGDGAFVQFASPVEETGSFSSTAKQVLIQLIDDAGVAQTGVQVGVLGGTAEAVGNAFQLCLCGGGGGQLAFPELHAKGVARAIEVRHI